MDDLEKAAIESAAKALLAPLTSPLSDLIGTLGGDQLAEYREAKRARRAAAKALVILEARRLIDLRKVTPNPNTPPEHLEEIVEAAQDTTVSELRDLYARLAAAAVDPDRQKNYRREFVRIVKELEPLDVLVLPILGEPGKLEPNRGKFISSKLSVHLDQVFLSFRKLEDLELADPATGGRAHTAFPALSPLGRQFLAAVKD